MGRVIVQSGKVIVSSESSEVAILTKITPLITVSMVHQKGFLSAAKNGQITLNKSMGNSEKFILESKNDHYFIKSHWGKYFTQTPEKSLLAIREGTDINERMTIGRKSTGLCKIRTHEGSYLSYQPTNNTIMLSSISDTEFEIINW